MGFGLNSPGKILMSAFWFGIFIALFLLIFKPFELDSISENNETLKILGYGPITSLVVILNYFILPKLFSAVFQTWKVYKELILSFFTILFISIGNWTYSVLASDAIFDVPSLLEFFLITLAVGIIPMTMFTLINERQALRVDLNELKISHGVDLNSEEEQNIIELKSDTKKTVKIPLNDLICIESFGNYCTVYFLLENQIKKEVIRKSLKSIEDQVNEFHQIKRCHKSYIVNANNILAVKGNAKGYRLKITDLDFEIPVSRTFPISNFELMQS